MKHVAVCLLFSCAALFLAIIWASLFPPVERKISNLCNASVPHEKSQLLIHDEKTAAGCCEEKHGPYMNYVTITIYTSHEDAPVQDRFCRRDCRIVICNYLRNLVLFLFFQTKASPSKNTTQWRLYRVKCGQTSKLHTPTRLY